MEEDEPRFTKAQKVTGGAIAAALAIATPVIMSWEGKRNIAYADIVGVPTVCYGHTGAGTGKVGSRKTDAECKTLLADDVQKHMRPILKCVPGLASRPNQLAASTILTFNIGTGGFCRSTAARRFNAGDWRGGCEAFMMWTRAGGRTVNGLVRRRRDERRICLAGLP
jgi:lysozyme